MNSTTAGQKSAATYSSVTYDVGRVGNRSSAAVAKIQPSISASEKINTRSSRARTPRDSRSAPVRATSGRIPPTTSASRASGAFMIHGRVSGQMGVNSGPLVRLANSGNKMNRFVPSTETLASNEYKFIIDLPASERSAHYIEAVAKAKAVTSSADKRKHLNTVLLLVLPIVVVVVVCYTYMTYHSNNPVRSKRWAWRGRRRGAWRSINRVFIGK